MDTALDYADVMLDFRDEILAEEANWVRRDDKGERFEMADVTDVQEAIAALVSSDDWMPYGVDGRLFDIEEHAQIAKALSAHGIELVQVLADCRCERADHFERIPTLMGVRR